MKIVKGVAALIVLIGIIIGVPLVLVALVGNPIPSGETLSGLLSRPDYGGQFFFGSLIPMVLWVLWGAFVVIVVLEIIAEVRGMNFPRLKGLGWQQAAAAGLITAILAMFTLGSVSMAPAAQAQELPTTTISQTLTTEQAPTPTQDATPAAASGPTYIVQPGDTLWKIAEQTLGDGTMAQKIADLNYNTPQPDGQSLTDGHWIQPGWTLTLPAGATGAMAGTYTVQEGDTLSGIAQALTGDADAAQQIFTASQNITQPGGEHLSDPDLIKPGWILNIPSATTASSAPTATEAPQERAPTTPAPAEETPKPAAEPAPVPNGTAPASETLTEPVAPAAESQPSTIPGASTAPTQVAPEPSAAAQDDQAPVESETNATAAPVPDWRTIGGLGAVACLGFLGVLGALRGIQRKRRTPGKKIAMPQPSAATIERQVRAVEDVDGVDALTTSLQYLALWAQDNAKELPRMFSARIAEDEIAIFLAEPADLPAPFVRDQEAGDGSVWTIDVEAIPELERIPSSPYPALVTLGQDQDNGQVLFELEFIGSLEITGPEDLQLQAIKAMTLELATSEWGQEMQITLVGVDDELATEIPTGRVRTVDDVDQLMTRLRGKAAATEKAFANLGVTTVEQARALGADAQSWMPEIVIIGTELPAEHRQELLTLVSQIPRMGIAAISAGALGDAESSWQLNLSRNATGQPGEASVTAILEPVGMELTPSLRSDEESNELLHLLRQTMAEDLPGDTWTANIDPAETPLEEVLTDADLQAQTTMRTIGYAPPTAEKEAHTETVEAAEPIRESDLVRPGADILPGDDAVAASPDSGVHVGPTTIEPMDEPVAVPSADDMVEEAALSADDTEAIKKILGKDTVGELEPIICFLGDVVVRGARGEIPKTAKQSVSTATVARCTAFAAFLALNPGASTEAFHGAFWPNQPISGKTASSNRNKLSNLTRNWLGTDSDGEPYLPHATTEGYQLAAGVRTDWDLFQDLIGEDLATTSNTRLNAALRLVRGQPFSGIKSQLMAWAEVDRQEMIMAVTDAAHEMANRSLRRGDAANAKLASEIGIKVDPTNEAMWRNGMKAAHINGDLAGVQAVVDRLRAFLDGFDDGYEPDPETQELIDHLLGERAVA